MIRKLGFVLLLCVALLGCLGVRQSGGGGLAVGSEGARSLSKTNQEQDSLFRFFASSKGRVAVSRKGRVYLGRTTDTLDVFAGKLLVDFGEEPSAASFDPAQLRLALGFSNRVVVLAIEKPESPWALTGLGGRIGAISFSPNGKSVTFSRMDNRIYRWRFLVSGSFLRAWNEERFEQYIGHGAVVSALAFHSFGRVFFSGDWNGDLFVWQAYDADEFGGGYDKNIFYSKFYTSLSPRLVRLRDPNDSIEKLVVSPDGQWLAVGLASGTVELWMIRGLKLVSYAKGHVGGILGIEFFPDSGHIASLGRDGKVVKWQVVDIGIGNPTSKYSGARLDLVPIGEYNDTEMQTISMEGMGKREARVVAGLSSGRIHEVHFEKVKDYKNLDQ